MPYGNKIFADPWIRFDRYEINGGYIRPAPGSKFEQYQPWADYGPPVGKDVKQQPYLSLIELIRDVKPPIAQGLNQDQETRILSWCSQHGLLGVLLHQTEMVILASERRAPSPLAAQLGMFLTGSPPLESFTMHIRKTRGWESRVITEWGGADRPPRALIRKLGTFEWVSEPLSKTWANFFPNARADRKEQEQYPTPFSDEFWQQYAEPVSSFLEAGRVLKRAVEGLQLISKSEWRDREAREFMDSLTATVRPYLFPASRVTGKKKQQKSRGRSFELGWTGPSLVSMFAMMATLDLAESRVLICRRRDCGHFFVTKLSTARYCSSRCRGTVQMRRYRRGKKED